MIEEIKHTWDNKRVSVEKRDELLKKRILELMLPPFKKTQREIGLMVNRSESTVKKFRNQLVQEGKLKVSDKGYVNKNDVPLELVKTNADLSRTEFYADPFIQKWKTSLQYSNIKKPDYMISDLWKVCNTINEPPEAFLQDPFIVQELVNKFVKLYREGKAVYIQKKYNPQDVIQQSKINPQHYIESIRSFIQRNGKTIPKGLIEVKREKSDEYPKIKLNDQERLKLIKYLGSKNEKFRDIFILHHELGVRTNTIFTMQPIFQKQEDIIDGVKCEFYSCYIKEEKQGKQYEKLIVTPKAREVVKKLENNKKIHSFTNIRKAKDEYSDLLRKFYALSGRISSDLEEQKAYEKGTQHWYLVNRPSHAIRHSCTHFWMRITGLDKDLVSTMFWDQPIVLEEYAKLTASEARKRKACYYCNPPDEIDPKWRSFCTLDHAMIYYNNGGKQKSEQT